MPVHHGAEEGLKVYRVVVVQRSNLAIFSDTEYLSRDARTVDVMVDRIASWGEVVKVVSVRDATPDDLGKLGYAI